jgi:hypothetical protein
MNLNMIYTMRGGEGKTALALYIAMETGAGIITNEQYTILEDYLPPERLYILKPGEDIPEPEDNWNVVYDFAGAVDERITEVAKQCQNVIVPVSHDHDSFKRGFGTIAEIESFNSNILVVANCMRETDFKKKGKKTANELHYESIKGKVEEFFDYPVLPVYKSKAFQRIKETKKSVSDIISSSPFTKLSRSWFEPVKTQMEDIMKFIGYNSKN